MQPTRNRVKMCSWHSTFFFFFFIVFLATKASCKGGGGMGSTLACEETHKNCVSDPVFDERKQAVHTAHEMVMDTINWVRVFSVTRDRERGRRAVVVMSNSSTIGNESNDNITALNDCVKLYEDSEVRLRRLLGTSRSYNNRWDDDDARTWLSGALTSHRSCLDGLHEKGLSFEPHHHHHEVAHKNLTFLLSRALGLYGLQNLHKKNGTPWRPKSEQNGLLATWDASTSKADFVVAKDGSGNFKTINEAVAALGRQRRNQDQPARVVIYVKSGVYRENVEIDRNMKNVMFVGDGIDKTVVTGNWNVIDGATTLSSATFGVSGDGFWARDMTFENTAGPVKEQAVALRVASDLSVFYRCSFKGYQDTLLLHSLRQFYRDCHIYGTIDFIFGNAAAVLQNCDIYVRRPMKDQGNMITAQGRDDTNENTGISIHGSRVLPAPDFEIVKGSFKSYLGRPWKKYSRTVISKTDLDGLIHPRGWREWRGDIGLSTLFYGEYMNSGVGAFTGKRVKWPGFHVLNQESDAGPFTVSRFIQGGTWIPETGIPFSPGV